MKENEFSIDICFDGFNFIGKNSMPPGRSYNCRPVKIRAWLRIIGGCRIAACLSSIQQSSGHLLGVVKGKVLSLFWIVCTTPHQGSWASNYFVAICRIFPGHLFHFDESKGHKTGLKCANFQSLISHQKNPNHPKRVPYRNGCNLKQRPRQREGLKNNLRGVEVNE